MLWEFADLVGRRLLAWGVLSALAGTVAMVVTGEAWWHGFGTQAIVWGVIDGAIGIAAVAGARRGRERTVGDWDAQRREARRLRRLLLVNAGLDVLYIAGGLALAGPFAGGDPFLQGTGWGIVVQGLFLLGFDLVHWRLVPDGSPLIPESVPLFEGPEHRSVRLDPSTATALEPASPGPAAVLLHGFGGTPDDLRGVAEHLAAQGFTVEAPLLPGFGAAIRELPDRRADEWRRTAQAAASGLRSAGHRPLLLVGHSMGAALSLAVAPSVRPDGIALIAPFWLPEPRWARLLGPFIRPFLPTGLAPLSRLDLDQVDVREGMAAFLPSLDLDDPGTAVMLRRLRVPVSLLAQLFVVSRWAAGAAPTTLVPVLAVIARQDTVAVPERARRLVDRLPRPATVLEVAGGHRLLEPASPVRPEVERAIADLGHQVVAGAHR